ncbi:MAG: retropepsin-like aspartic protease [bacterium]
MRKNACVAILAFLMCLSSSAYAQKVLEMFEGQNDLPETSGGIRVESMDKGTVSEFSDSGADSGITLVFEHQGSSILVPATVQGKPVYFLFDTGATTTTLSYDFAKSAGILPKADYPVIQVQTANGPAFAQFGLISQLVLGGRNHAGVSYTVCDNCPTGVYKGKPIVGLLGLNVINRYRVSIDNGSGKIEMFASASYSDRKRDIEPWLQMGDVGAKPDGKGNYVTTVSVHNKAPRTISELTLVLTCTNGNTVELGQKSISAGSKAKFSKAVDASKCMGAGFDIVGAKW